MDKNRKHCNSEKQIVLFLNAFFFKMRMHFTLAAFTRVLFCAFLL